MAVVKCPKCGADIPEGADFCPACGAPKAVEAARQQGTSGSSSLQGLFDTIFTEIIIYIMILLGLLFACIGGILVLFTAGTAGQIGGVLNSLGFVFIGTFLLMGGLVNNSFDKFVRVGMIISGALSLTWTLSWVA
jgi:hypothetical protein